MTVKIKINDSKFGRKVKKLSEVPDQVTEEAYKYFKKTTPIRSGNARRKTKQKGNAIIADYPYARRLDEGYSRQAPRGMTEPTLKFIQRKMNQLIRRSWRG